MKILFVAVFTPNSTNVSQSRGFKDNGCEVYEYDYRNRLNVLRSIEKRDDELINLINLYKPNLVLFSKCNQMHYRVIDESNKVSKTCLWYMDPMNNFNNELIEKIKRSTFCISGFENVTPHMLKYNNKSYFIHQCPDEILNRKLENINYIRDVAFIGSIDGGVHSDRASYKNVINFEHFYGVYGEEHNKIVNETKINLNFAPTDKSGCSVRLYKIMASGGFVMTTPWNNMEETFTIDKHLVVFNSIEELKEKIKYYLDNPKEREIIKENGYIKVQEYMPKNWAKNIIEIYEKN